MCLGRFFPPNKHSQSFFCNQINLWCHGRRLQPVKHIVHVSQQLFLSLVKVQHQDYFMFTDLTVELNVIRSFAIFTLLRNTRGKQTFAPSRGARSLLWIVSLFRHDDLSRSALPFFVCVLLLYFHWSGIFVSKRHVFSARVEKKVQQHFYVQVSGKKIPVVQLEAP